MIELTQRCPERRDAHGMKVLVKEQTIFCMEGRMDADGTEYTLLSMDRVMMGQVSIMYVSETVEQIKEMMGR